MPIQALLGWETTKLSTDLSYINRVPHLSRAKALAEADRRAFVFAARVGTEELNLPTQISRREIRE